MRCFLCLSVLLIYGCQPVFAATGDEVRAYFSRVFDGAVSLASDETNYDSSKEIIGYPDYSITQDISQVAIAEREGRVFVNPDANALPDGAFTFIVTNTGDIEFGLIENDIEIGVKHFQLAKGRALFVAGEFTKFVGSTRLSIKSGTFSRWLKNMNGYSEPETMAKMEKAFRDLWGLDMKMEIETLYSDPEQIEIGVLFNYCRHPEFYEFHKHSICREYVKGIAESCAAKVAH